MSPRVTLVGLLIALALPARSSAAEPPTKAATQEGRERFKRGIELFRDADFRAALIEFNRANEVAPSFRIQFNIGQTCLELQDYACALHAFREYLATGLAEVPKDRRQLLEREVQRLERLVGSVRVTATKDGAEVTVDETVVGRTPLLEPVVVGAGRHKITVSLVPLPAKIRVVDIAGGDHLDVAFDLTEPTLPPAAPVYNDAPPPPETAKPTEATREAKRSGAPLLIGLATTGALGVGAAITGVFALSAHSDLEATAGRRGATPHDVDSAQSKVKTLSAVTDVLLVSTVVAAAITTIIFFAGRPSASKPAELQRAQSPARTSWGLAF